MINVTRLNGKQIMINAELIESVEETPDTVVTLTDGKKFVVKEPINNNQYLVAIMDVERLQNRLFSPISDTLSPVLISKLNPFNIFLNP